MDYLKNVFGRKQIKFLIISGISLLAGVIVLLMGIRMSESLKAENMAARWSDGNEFTEVSVFFSELAEYDENRIRQLAYSAEKKFKEDSLVAEPNARLWLYAYSSVGKVNISSANTSLSIKAIGVGGDFFAFHPVQLITGSVFNDDNINDDLVVIDRETSFNLFGSTDVVGQPVDINGSPFFICGVIERDEGRLNELAGNGDPIAYIYHSAVKDEGMHINMFEAVMPNPVSGYAVKIISDNVGVDEKYHEIVENTGRFHFTRLLKMVKYFGTRSMNSKGIVYPYWENMARGMEDYLTPLALLGLILFLIPISCVVYLIARLWRLRTIHWANIKDFIERLVERNREKRKNKNTSKKAKNTKTKKKKTDSDEDSDDDFEW